MLNTPVTLSNIPEMIQAAVIKVKSTLFVDSITSNEAKLMAKYLTNAIKAILQTKSADIKMVNLILDNYPIAAHALTKHGEHMEKNNISSHVRVLCACLNPPNAEIKHKLEYIYRLATLHAYLARFEKLKQAGRNQLAGFFVHHLDQLDIMKLENGTIDVSHEPDGNLYRYENLILMIITSDIVDGVTDEGDLYHHFENIRTAGQLNTVLPVDIQVPGEDHFVSLYKTTFEAFMSHQPSKTLAF